MKKINIAGFQANSFVDWPGVIASVVFLGGCNFRCHYCHNHNILSTTSNTIPFAGVLSKIREQLGFIDGVVISGGEPTLHPSLLEIIDKIRALGLKIKLDTNGTNPVLLKNLVESGKIDYVAMDIKGPLSRYQDIVCAPSIALEFPFQRKGCPEGAGYVKKRDGIISEISKSIEFIKSQTKIGYMFRMTLSPMLTETDIRDVARLVKGAKAFQLQQFVPNDFSNSHKTVLLPYTSQQAEKFASEFKNNVETFTLRGF